MTWYDGVVAASMTRKFAEHMRNRQTWLRWPCKWCFSFIPLQTIYMHTPRSSGLSCWSKIVFTAPSKSQQFCWSCTTPPIWFCSYDILSVSKDALVGIISIRDGLLVFVAMVSVAEGVWRLTAMHLRNDEASSNPVWVASNAAESFKTTSGYKTLAIEDDTARRRSGLYNIMYFHRFSIRLCAKHYITLTGIYVQSTRINTASEYTSSEELNSEEIACKYMGQSWWKLFLKKTKTKNKWPDTYVTHSQ